MSSSSWIDLTNLKNLFVIANCRTHNEHQILPVIKYVAMNQPVFCLFQYEQSECYIYEQKEDLIMTFTCYDATDLMSLWYGLKMWSKQNLNKMGMYQFLADLASDYYEQLKPFLNTHFKKYPKGNLYITGISIGGALSQIFYYYLKQDFDPLTNITTFGSPRIGNQKLKNWYLDQKKLTLSNYVLFNADKQVDPIVVCPQSNEKQPYVNNANLIMLYQNKITPHVVEHELNEQKQPDTALTIASLISSDHWDEGQNVTAYFKGLPLYSSGIRQLQKSYYTNPKKVSAKEAALDDKVEYYVTECSFYFPLFMNIFWVFFGKFFIFIFNT